MLAHVQTVLLFVLPYLCVLTVVVTIHELGHFLTARAFGVAIDRFSIGFGPPLVAWRDKSGIEWRISWIPLGGYVRFAGDENAASVPDAEDLAQMRKEIALREGVGAVKRYFHFKPLWQRALIVAAGPFANFVLAVAIFAGLFGAFGQVDAQAKVGRVVPQTPAAAAGFQVGDLITEADGRRIDGFRDLRMIIVMRAGTPIDFKVLRAGTLIDLVAAPIRAPIKDALVGHPSGGVLGIENDPKAPPIIRTYGPIEAVAAGVKETGKNLELTLFYIGRIFTGHESGDQLAGPLRTLAAAGAAAQQGAISAEKAHISPLFGILINSLQMAGLISVAVGFMNLLPIPVLDGGHLLFYAYEGAARRPLGARAQAAGYRVGLVLILGLVLFATWNDIQQLRVFQFLGGLFS
jgi:regulator of sigma E protease